MLFVSRGLYGQRKWSHIDFYKQEDKLYFLEVGSWTVELDTEMAMHKNAAFYMPSKPLIWAAAALTGVAHAAVDIEHEHAEMIAYAWTAYLGFILYKIKGT